MQNLPINALPEPLAVVCHDAGATNVLAAWLELYDKAIRIYAKGPAAEILSARFPQDCFVNQLEQVLDGAHCLLSGTGWASDVEHQARKLARVQGIYSIAVIDHWVNYPQRFIRDDEQILPDEIWVADDDAMEIAKQAFPGMLIQSLPNLYLASQVAEINALARDNDLLSQRPQLLYLLEPVRSDWGQGDRAGEFQALDHFLEHLAALKIPEDVQIVLRPHPSETTDKYTYVLKKFPKLTILISNEASLAEQIALSDWVVGCESFALIVALDAGRKVISTLPPWAPKCRLPHRYLRHIRDVC